MRKRSLLVKFLVWRMRNIADEKFILFLSVIIGLVVGLAAVVIKNSVHFIQFLLHSIISEGYTRYLYFLFPLFGISIVILFLKFVIRHEVKHGIPGVLYAISTARGRISRHNMFSSIITSAFTVGFGGSVGLEGPTVATGAALGANIGRLFRLNYKHIILLLGCACAGAMASIFKAPITAIVFSMEVIMVSLTLTSIVPILLSSVTAALTSYLFLGREAVYPFKVDDVFVLQDIPSFILLGIVCGLLAVYFKRVYVYIENKFDKIQKKKYRLLIGGSLLGLILFLFPPLYGEGYAEINMALSGDYSYLFRNSIFSDFHNNIYMIAILFLCIIFIKVIATALTFGAGGIGGIFAPTLFIGVNTGLFFAVIFDYFEIVVSHSNLAFLGMGGMIAAVLHAPLTGIFLIADITGGYSLLVPLMLTAIFSYATVRIFEQTSVYTHELARRKQLITHNKDKAVLYMLSIAKLIERNFVTVDPDATLGALVEAVKKSKRNLYPIVDEEGTLYGIIKLDDVREILFDAKNYDKIFVRNLMYMPRYFFSPDDSMEDVVKVIQRSGHYNFPVLKNGKYIGFISRARVFSAYKKMSEYFSDE